ncbi:S1 family peptidase [Streptomyces sp. NPDC023998]|uniref:S1 family peptidase n=1 Tax=Streptomyces sp. NPDC023998 TaxID=3154597 RepID=UPI0033E0E660
MVAAFARDFGVSPDQARNRLVLQGRQIELAHRLEKSLGERGAGSWIDHATGKLYANVLDEAAGRTARAQGATPRLVPHSLRRLRAVEQRLDRATGGRPAASGSRWYIDMVNNHVVLAVPQGTRDAASSALLKVAAEAGSLVRVEREDGRLRDTADNLYGGVDIYNSSSHCSTGFNVQGPSVLGYRAQYVLTAGHCMAGGASAHWYSNGRYVGPVTTYTYANQDHAIIATNTVDWVPQPSVWRYDGMVSPVRGSTNVTTGSYVCKFGRTTGFTCGTVTATNVTASTPTGTKTGQVQTNLCVEPGDSGGSVLAGNLAAGLTSSSVTYGPGKVCGQKLTPAVANVALFQPIGPVLTAYGVSLRTQP